jgi:hypothetical protein
MGTSSKGILKVVLQEQLTKKDKDGKQSKRLVYKGIRVRNKLEAEVG